MAITQINGREVVECDDCGRSDHLGYSILDVLTEKVYLCTSCLAKMVEQFLDQFLDGITFDGKRKWLEGLYWKNRKNRV